MISYSIIYKVNFTVLLHFAILLSLVTRAEEASILTSATVIGDIGTDWCPSP